MMLPKIESPSRVGLFTILLAATILFASPATAQFSWDNVPTNLKVLPDSISSSELRAIMRSFSQGLGVDCSYCHDDSKGRRLDDFDFASDAKPEKEIARLMMGMVREINREYIAKVSHGETEDVPRVSVTCMTCHRGTDRPARLEDVLAATIDAHGSDAGREKYAELRERYFGRMAYDFSQWSLNNLGYTLLGEGKVDEAIDIFRLNVEMYPDEWNPNDSLADGYLAAGDTTRALVFLQKSLQLNPDNEAGAERLANLK